LVTMHDKNGIEPLLTHFHTSGVEVVATPNTAKFLHALGYTPLTTFEFTKCKPIWNLRGSLHPHILAAIEADPSKPIQVEELNSVGIKKIDMIFVNTKDPVVSDEEEPTRVLQQLAKVNIGGPGLLRWVIKNWRTCAAVVDSGDYPALLSDLKNNNNRLSLSIRIRLLMHALQYLSYKDNQSANLLKAFWPPIFGEG